MDMLGPQHPAMHDVGRMRKIIEGLLGSNEPYGNLFNCIHDISKYFPCDTGEAAVNKTLTHEALMLASEPKSK